MKVIVQKNGEETSVVATFSNPELAGEVLNMLAEKAEDGVEFEFMESDKEIVQRMIQEHPNDMSLGKAIRSHFRK